MLNDRRTLIVVNESTVVTDTDAWRAAWALGYQVRWQFAPLWGIDAYVSFAGKGGITPPGASILHILDTADQEGALGYHDVDGGLVPFARVFAKTSEENGQSFSEVLSHEGLELLADPLCRSLAYDPKTHRLYPQEVGDPVQGGAYDLGAPYGRTTGIVMSDFALPEWFDEETPDQQATSFRATVLGPFKLGAGGYLAYQTALGGEYQQEFGEHADRKIADADDRHQQRIAV